MKPVSLREIAVLFFHFVARYPITSLVLLEFFLVIVGQFWSLARVGIRTGFGRIVSLAGSYGDMVLAVAIVPMSQILTEQKFSPAWEGLLWITVAVLYLVSVMVAQKYLPPPRIEDIWHNLVVLPVFVIILVVGGIFCISSFAEKGWDDRFWVVLAAVGFWFLLLLVDIKYGRLDQEGFMKKHHGITI